MSSTQRKATFIESQQSCLLWEIAWKDVRYITHLFIWKYQSWVAVLNCFLLRISRFFFAIICNFYLCQFTVRSSWSNYWRQRWCLGWARCGKLMIIELGVPKPWGVALKGAVETSQGCRGAMESMWKVPPYTMYRGGGIQSREPSDKEVG